MYAIAFISLRMEIVECAGERGVLPVRDRLRRMRTDSGLLHAVLRHPSLLWFSSSDRALRWIPLAGISAATLAICGVASPLMFVVCWICYLSLDVAMSFVLPWESLLLEAGFLTLFLPALALLPSVAMRPAPAPLLAWCFQWLLFRVMFGFGKLKFTGDAVADPLYLRGFLINQPMPTPLGWRAWRLPRRVLVCAHAGAFVVEMVLPFLIFFPGAPRTIAAIGIAGLMIGIQLGGNFGFFNVLVVALCVSLLDGRSVLSQRLSDTSPVVVGLAAWVLVAGLIHLPLNSWVTQSWLEWPVWAGVKSRVSRAVIAGLRAAQRLRTVHAYGVFPPRSAAPIKWIPVIEGTEDGVRWETYEYLYMPSSERSRPRFVAPLCPHFDHFVFYDAYGMAGSFFSTAFGRGSHYDFYNVNTFDRLLQRLLEPYSSAQRLFRRVPFDGRTPRAVRANLYAFVPTTPLEQRTTGRWWSQTLVAEHVPERRADPSMWDRWLPSPTQFHPDDHLARRRARQLRPLLAQRGTLEERALATLDEDSRRLWPRFWNEIVPVAAACAESRWASLASNQAALVTAFGASTLDAFDRVRGAVTMALLVTMEPYLFGREQPRLTVESYFHASLLAHQLVLDGLDACEARLADPRLMTVVP
ncbi:MAG: lipase maturation factor family protein, partial [Gemmatimonadaceae bacterium]